MVERYRLVVHERSTKHKRVGYDSAPFISFKDAVKAVAAFNGHFKLVQQFNEAYPNKPDKVSKQRCKNEKKRRYPLAEVDAQIERLEPRFNHAVKFRKFDRANTRTALEADTAARLCIFYVMILTLRIMGLRQQNIRNLKLMRNLNKLDGNIGIRHDGTVIFHFEPEETKNGKRLHSEWNLRDHGETHGKLIHAVLDYHKYVLPYIRANALEDLEDQFFVHMPKQCGKFRRFDPHNNSILYSRFIWWGYMFLDFEDARAADRLMLNPHHFRGLCTDWLINVLGFTFEQAADYIADDPLTIKLEYLDRNRTHDPTQHVSDTNRVIRARDSERRARGANGKATPPDAELMTLSQRVELLQSQVESATEIKAALQAQLASKDERISRLEEELGRLRAGA